MLQWDGVHEGMCYFTLLREDKRIIQIIMIHRECVCTHVRTPKLCNHDQADLILSEF